MTVLQWMGDGHGEEGMLPFGDALRILAAGRSSEFRGFMKARGGVLSVVHSVGHICNKVLWDVFLTKVGKSPWKTGSEGGRDCLRE